jgi:hypothetical protein
MIVFNYSCAKKEPAQSPDSDILVGKISAQFSDFNINIESEKAKDLFGGDNNTDFSKVENFSVRQSEYGETGVFKLYSEVSVDYIKDTAQKRILNLQENSGNLDDLVTANDGEVRSYGNYVYYVSHSEKDRIFKIIEDELKGV